MKKILFVPFSFRCPQHKNAASVRLRCTWPAKYMPEAVVASTGAPDPSTDFEMQVLKNDPDIIIFQKVYGQLYNRHASTLKERGKKIVLDLCDPEWKQGGPWGMWCLEMMDIADLITVPTPRMGEEVKKVMEGRKPNVRIAVLEDCLDLEYHREVKTDWWKDRPTVLWFGNSGTVSALTKYIPELEELYAKKPFDLRIISNVGTILPESKIPTDFIEWKLETFVEEALKCDIVFNPKLPNEIDSLKSRNKTYTAWACGLPAVEVWAWSNREQWMDELFDFLEDPLRRRDNGLTGRKLYEQHGTSEHYAERLREILHVALGD